MNRYGSAWAAMILTVIAWGQQPLQENPQLIPLEIIDVRTISVIPPDPLEEQEEALPAPTSPVFSIPIGSPAEIWYLSAEKDGPRIAARWHKMIAHALSAHG